MSLPIQIRQEARARQGTYLKQGRSVYLIEGGQRRAEWAEGAEGLVHVAVEQRTGVKYRIKCFWEPDDTRLARSKYLVEQRLSNLEKRTADVLGGAPFKLIETIGGQSRFAVLMKNIEGRTWKDLREEAEHLGEYPPPNWPTFRTRLLWTYGLVCAVERMEAHGFVHADLSPGNVVVRPDGEQAGDIALVDFDAYFHPDHHSKYKGTDGFVAPEIWNRGAIGVGSDRVAMAILIQDMLLVGDSRIGSEEVFAASYTQDQISALQGTASPYFEQWHTDLAQLVDATLRSAIPSLRPAPAVWRAALLSIYNRLAAGASASAIVPQSFESRATDRLGGWRTVLGSAFGRLRGRGPRQAPVSLPAAAPFMDASPEMDRAGLSGSPAEAGHTESRTGPAYAYDHVSLESPDRPGPAPDGLRPAAVSDNTHASSGEPKRRGHSTAKWRIVAPAALALILGAAIAYIEAPVFEGWFMRLRAAQGSPQVPPKPIPTPAPPIPAPVPVPQSQIPVAQPSATAETENAQHPPPKRPRPVVPTPHTGQSKKPPVLPKQLPDPPPSQPRVLVAEPPDSAQLLNAGKTQFANHDIAAARESFRKAADAGDLQAMVLLGAFFAQGLGGPKSDSESVSLFRKAAELGSARGMYNLGLMCESGRGVPERSDTQAAGWYSKAADLGDHDSAYRLGLMYESGRGVAQDLDAARRLYAKAGTPDASARLAKLPSR